MTAKQRPKNLTISLSDEEYDDLNELVDYFQKQSISTVTRSDVVKFMLRQMKEAIDKDRLEEMRELIEGE